MEHHGTSWIIMELRIECRLIMIDPRHRQGKREKKREKERKERKREKKREKER